MLLRSEMDLSKFSKSFIEAQDVQLDKVRKLLIKKKANVKLDDNNFYLNSSGDLKFHCFICNKDFYLSSDMIKYSNSTHCSNHRFTTYKDPEITQEEKEEKEKRIEKYKEEVKEFPLKNESGQARKLKIYLSKKYSAKLEYKECVNPKTGYFLPYDIYVPKYKAYIEVNGSQHYHIHDTYHKNKENFEYQKYKDHVKKEHAQKNGFFIELNIDDFKTYDEYFRPVENPKDIIEEVEKIFSEIEGRFGGID